jgi:hypothetical protein
MNTFGKMPYPNRSPFAPQSGQVQSDQEFATGWQNHINSISPTVREELGRITPWWQDANINSLSQTAPGFKDAYSTTEKMANSLGVTLTQDMNNGGFMVGSAPELAMNYRNVANPEYAAAQDAFSQASKFRGENQIRQQQAYDTTLMGNNAIGGALPGNYADPNFGQVTGKVGGLGGLGGTDLTGINADSQTGAYSGGSGAYNPTPWGAGWQKSNPWGGF